MTPRCLLALRFGANILNPLHAWPNKASYELRLAKYAHRGFAVAIAGLDKQRVDDDRIRKTKLVDFKGMARLLKIWHAVEKDVESVMMATVVSPRIRQQAQPFRIIACPAFGGLALAP